MYNRRSKYLIRILLSQLFIGLIMLALGFIVIFYAQGYRFNFQAFKVIKMGMVFMVANQKTANVYVNNRLVSNQIPYASNLMPGSYTIEIKKDGYKPWREVTEIKPELVSDYKSIILFLDKIESNDLLDQTKISLLSVPDDIVVANVSNELNYNEYEIWVNDRLVTRFSKPISKAIWYPDYQHILYQQGDEIRIVEKSGFNDTHLVKISSDNPTHFVIGNKGEELYYLDNDKYKMAKIR